MRLPAIVAILVLLSGCAGERAAPTARVEPAPQGSVVFGTVVDDEFRALPNATVAHVGTNRKTTTDANGSFRLSGLPETGVHEFAASATGFVPHTTRVDLTGVPEADVRFVLRPLVVELNHHTTPFVGRIACQASVGPNHGAFAPLVVPCDAPLDPNKVSTTVAFKPGVVWAVLEMIWDPHDQSSRNLDMAVDLLMPNARAHLGHRHSDHDNYYVALIPAPTILETAAATGGSFRTTVNVTGSVLDDHAQMNAGLALGQEFKHYTTVFYERAPGVFWTAIR